MELFSAKEADGLMVSAMKLRERLNSTRDAFYAADDDTRRRLKDLEDLTLNMFDMLMASNAAILTLDDALTAHIGSSSDE